MIQHDAVIDGSEQSEAVVRLMSGEVFTGLMIDQAEQRAQALEAVLKKVVDDGTKVVWIGNPLRSPLTMERFLLQIVGPEIDLRLDRSPAELARLIARRDGAETRLLVVVHQPETIDPQTLEQLGALAGHFGEEAVQAQFLFVGSPALRLPAIARADFGQLLPCPAQTEMSAEDCVGSPPRRRDVLPLILLLLLSCLGAVISLAPPPQDFQAGSSTSAANGATHVTDANRLRAKFGAFLNQRVTPSLSGAQKDALFKDFLTFYRNNPLVTGVKGDSGSQ